MFKTFSITLFNDQTKAPSCLASFSAMACVQHLGVKNWERVG